MTFMHPLIAEAAKKAAVAWLTTPGGGQAYPIWGVWINDALHLVAGSGEQSAPGLAEAAAGGVGIHVTMRGDHGGRVVRWPATVTELSPNNGDWDEIAPQVATKRLNAPTGVDQTVKHWSAECAIFRLTPSGDPDQAADTLPDDDLAACVRQSPNLRLPKKPFRLHKVRGA